MGVPLFVSQQRSSPSLSYVPATRWGKEGQGVTGRPVLQKPLLRERPEALRHEARVHFLHPVLSLAIPRDRITRANCQEPRQGSSWSVLGPDWMAAFLGWSPCSFPFKPPFRSFFLVPSTKRHARLNLSSSLEETSQGSARVRGENPKNRWLFVGFPLRKGHLNGKVTCAARSGAASAALPHRLKGNRKAPRKGGNKNALLGVIWAGGIRRLQKWMRLANQSQTDT